MVRGTGNGNSQHDNNTRGLPTYFNGIICEFGRIITYVFWHNMLIMEVKE